MKTLTVRTHQPQEFSDITSVVAKAVTESGLTEGMVLVFVPHTTAGITLNEHDDAAVAADIVMELGKMVPQVDSYKHSEGNSAAHIKASMMGSSVTVPLAGGTMALGKWQGIFLCEFDGPRARQVHVQVLPGTATPKETR